MANVIREERNSSTLLPNVFAMNCSSLSYVLATANLVATRACILPDGERSASIARDYPVRGKLRSEEADDEDAAWPIFDGSGVWLRRMYHLVSGVGAEPCADQK
jgi:hypothetical protein